MRRLLALTSLLLACAPSRTETLDGGTTGAADETTAPSTTSGTSASLPTTDTGADGQGTTGAPSQPVLVSISPAVVDPLGGSHVILRGAELVGTDAVTIGGIAVTSFEVIDDTEVHAITAPTAVAPALDVVLDRDGELATLDGAAESWSPAELPGARLFDAAHGLELEESTTIYEWQRLTAEIDDAWRVRDGNTTTWLPATERYWMVGGWNGLQEPDGFSMVPPDTVYPPQNTTDEVWSSADGIVWTLELPHGHGQFERRHSHNTVVWNDRLWMIGGDAHQGYYNHDVVSSADGITWTVELGPGAAPPPWSARVLQVSGVFDDKLWMVGGQDGLGPPDEYVHHNDVWNTEDGVTWTQIAADAPASATRWAGCGVLDGLVEHRGEMWLVGCARERGDAVGHTMSNEVWSTTDGVDWTLHAEPPWVGKIWPNVVVWDDRLWILFGYTYGDPDNGWTARNATEAWYSDDGETWTALPIDAPVPGSHAQGVATTDSSLLLAGGNYSFGFGAGFDRSTWRLVAFRGRAVRTWVDRGADALAVIATDDLARPLHVPDAFGDDIAGLQFDGSASVLALADPQGDAQPDGRSVFWVARAPHLPAPWGWIEDYAPLGTVVGGPDLSGLPVSSIGLSDGRVTYLNREPGTGPSGEPLWSHLEAGHGLQEGPGQVRMAGITHGVDEVVTTWIDGVAIDRTGVASYATPRMWSRIGGGMDTPYYAPHTRFAGTIGAVIVLPHVADEATVVRIHAWAQGRFLAP